MNEARLFTRTKTRDYYVEKDGNIYYLTYTRRGKLIADKKHVLKQHVLHRKNSDYLIVYIRGEKYPVRNIVASVFMSDYNPTYVVNNIDGNFRNCNINNLQLVSHKYLSKKGNLSKVAVRVTETFSGMVKTFPSLSQAAKALFVDRRTLYSYRKEKANSRALDGYKVELIKDGKVVELTE